MTTLDPSMHSAQSATGSQRERAMVAHDIRGALHGVIGGVAMLDRAELAPAVRGQFERIAAAATTLICLVNGLLDEELSREQRAAHGQVDLSRFMRHIVKRWSGEAEERGMRLHVDVASDVPGVLRADLISLARALGNLIGNALKYAHPGDVEVILRRTADGGAAFSVIDFGPGVPSETIDAVLRPGRRMPALSADGHGLGLHIARSLCTDLGGSFGLMNRPTGGAEASLVFPGVLCGVVPAQGSEAPPAPPAGLDGLRILLAEDNPTNQMVATQMLRALRAEVTLSADGVEALEKFETGNFDLVVVDIEMPRMTGLDVIRTIRSRGDARASVPIVALTAYAMREHRDRIAAAGANGLISKPITSVEALGEALRAHVAPARRTAPAAEATSTPTSDEPVADLAVFDALCAAIGPGMMAELLEKVVADLLQARSDLAGALAPLDRKPIRSASHILISVAGAIGATRLQSCARAINVAAHGEDGRSLPGDVRRCLDEIDAAVAFAHSRRVGV